MTHSHAEHPGNRATNPQSGMTVGSSVKTFFKMAASPSFDFPDADGYYSERMHVPQKIMIPDVADDHAFASREVGANPPAPKRFDMTSSMSIPERIVVNQPFDSPIRRDVTDDVTLVTGIGMGGMITPPRTLTVDDTASAYYPRGRPATANEPKANRESAVTRVDTDVDSLSAGLEMINDVSPQDIDSESEFATVDVKDIRKCMVQVRHLSQQVRQLEQEVDRGTMGFWSKMMFFAFTFINPLVLHWLFLKRR